MVFLVLLVPLLVMAFALFMERIEHRLHTRTVSEQDVEEFLDKAQPDEVDTFVKEGWTRALSKFRLRSRKNRPSWRARLFTASKPAAKPPSKPLPPTSADTADTPVDSDDLASSADSADPVSSTVSRAPKDTTRAPITRDEHHH